MSVSQPSDIPTPASGGDAPLLPGEVDLRGFWIGGAVLLVLVGVVFRHFLGSQVRYAIEHQADWGHTMVIPVFVGYFIYLRRHDLLRVGFRTTWVGLIPLVLGIGWYVLTWLGEGAFATLNHHNLRGAGFGLALFGLTLLFCGWRAMRYLLFPLCFLLLFGQTISDKFMEIVTQELQDITAVGAQVVLGLATLDVDRDGNVLTVWQGGTPHPLNIAEACSGMRMLMAFLALGTAMAYTGLRHRWQQIALVLLAVPTAIVVNVLRVVTLGVLSMFDSGFAAGDFHEFVGLVWLVPAFFIYLGLVWLLRKMVIEGTPGGAA
ncbi:MAG: exosortase/archaeosortase family protein [Phycisphaerales bacterium]|nr:exosortase/archaeosortase family protein [Phycisphaerales bacterium]